MTALEFVAAIKRTEFILLKRLRDEPRTLPFILTEGGRDSYSFFVKK